MLTELKARNIKPTDRPIADGTVRGLRLHPGKKIGQGKWLLRFVSPATNKRREMGFGAYPEVSITEARTSAAAARDLIREGMDPIEARKVATQARQRDAQALTFEEAARKVHEDLRQGWQNPRHAANWITSLEMYVFHRIGNRKIKDLKAGDFADTLRPIWISKADTAYRDIWGKSGAAKKIVVAEYRRVAARPQDADDSDYSKPPTEGTIRRYMKDFPI